MAIPLGIRQGMILSSAINMIERDCDAGGEWEGVKAGNEGYLVNRLPML